MKSKENKIIELFYNNPTKEWHFEEIIKEAKIARSKANEWLKKFKKDKIIRRVKNKGKMPYYISNHDSPEYMGKKRIFALNKLYESGFLNHLLALEKAEAIIIFGSFTRSDWFKDSDIDIFIYGNSKKLDLYKYELKLNRNIHVFACKNKQELLKYGKGLLRNILKGNLIKGSLEFVKVDVNA